MLSSKTTHAVTYKVIFLLKMTLSLVEERSSCILAASTSEGQLDFSAKGLFASNRKVTEQSRGSERNQLVWSHA